MAKRQQKPDAAGRHVVIAGNPDFNGKLSGVQFENGRAEVEDEALARYLAAEWGFTTTDGGGVELAADSEATGADADMGADARPPTE